MHVPFRCADSVALYFTMYPGSVVAARSDRRPCFPSWSARGSADTGDDVTGRVCETSRAFQCQHRERRRHEAPRVNVGRLDRIPAASTVASLPQAS